MFRFLRSRLGKYFDLASWSMAWTGELVDGVDGGVSRSVDGELVDGVVPLPAIGWMPEDGDLVTGL